MKRMDFFLPSRPCSTSKKKKNPDAPSRQSACCSTEETNHRRERKREYFYSLEKEPKREKNECLPSLPLHLIRNRNDAADPTTSPATSANTVAVPASSASLPCRPSDAVMKAQTVR